MSKVTFTNFASTRTTSVLSSLNTTFSITPGTGANFPTCSGGDWFYCVLTDSLTAPTVREVVKVASRSGDSFSTVVRAQDGTTALNWPSGSYCELRLTKGALEEIQALLATALQAANDLSDLASVITARSNLGLGSMALQNAGAVSILGGAISGCQVTNGTLDITPVGSLSPSTGSFTTLAASGAVSGAGFTARFAAPGPIGSVTPGTGAFTTLSASGAVSGAGFDAYMASPPAIGGTVPAAGAFTSLTSVVSTAGIAGLSATNSDAGAFSIGALSAYNDLGFLCVVGTASSGWALSDVLGPNYGVLYSQSDLSITTALNKILFGINGTSLITTMDSTGITANFGYTIRAYAAATAPYLMSGKIHLNTTAVGNVGVGTDNLMTYSLPADVLGSNGKGLRITAWGTLANNANAKTLTINFGSATLASDAMTISGALNWKIVAEIFRTGANAQAYVAEIMSSGNGLGVRDFDIESGTSAETDTAAITIKCTGAATADNDIVQKGMMVEFIN